MEWPTRAETWGERIDAAREAYGEVAEAIARFEPVTMITKPKNVAEVSLLTASGINTFSLPHDDSWMRDNGPTFVVEYCNVQNGANHIHVVWRDYETDFGGRRRVTP